jgi:8-oxo-dGTP pyrophosphatase MutT (NUDIX family)/broad specificity phosphatase PhoE
VAPIVRAAGGVVWRPSAAGPQVCVVHRDRYDDWSLPKGHLDAGEHPLAAAVREVHEETGVRATPQVRLPPVTYRLPDGAPKSVEFWLMQAGDAPADAPDDEVDAVAWLSFADAAARVSYPDDVRTLTHAADLPTVTAVVPLVRHGHAGKRDAFPGDDAARPLDDRGRAEADGLSPLLALFAPQRIHSATPLRCRQTVAPLAARRDLPVTADPAFDEPGNPDELSDRVERAAARLRELAGGDRTVVCSQGKVIPGLLALLDGRGDPTSFRTPKGTGWVLSFAGDRLIGLERLVGGS